MCFLIVWLYGCYYIKAINTNLIVFLLLKSTSWTCVTVSGEHKKNIYIYITEWELKLHFAFGPSVFTFMFVFFVVGI